MSSQGNRNRIEFVSERAHKEFLALSATDRELARAKFSQPIPPNKDRAYHNGNARKRGLRYWHLRDNLIIVFKPFKEVDGRGVMLAIGTHKEADFFSDNYNGHFPSPLLTPAEAGILSAEEAECLTAAPPLEMAEDEDDQAGKALLRIIRAEARAASAPELEAAIDAVNDALGELSGRIEATTERQAEADEALRLALGEATAARAELEQIRRPLAVAAEKLNQQEGALAELHRAVTGLTQALREFARQAGDGAEELRLAHAQRLERVEALSRQLMGRSSDHTARLNQLDHQQRQAEGRADRLEQALAAKAQEPQSWFASVTAFLGRCIGHGG